jgi:hypothetical protein
MNAKLECRVRLRRKTFFEGVPASDADELIRQID